MNKPAIAADSQAKDKTNDKPSTKRIRDEKPRKKEDKSVEHVLKALNSLETTEEKLAALCQKYAEMFNDHRLLQNAAKQAERRNTILQKEKELLQSEHSKAVLTRSRLENLCRELQRQNKAVKEECMLKMREEGEKKREVAAKFHSMLSEIGSLLAQNNDKNAKLRDDNLDMSARLKSVCDQFEKKEQHVENLAKQMQLEMQLAEAKLAKARMEMDIEKETLQKEKQQLLIELADYKRKLCEMKASELALKEQIQVYSDKYEEFHKALLQSNGAIGDFKAEMERMTKHIRRLEKETATWKARYDSAQRTLTRVTEDKIRSEEARALSDRRLGALQGLCRRLQDHCKQLRDEKTIDSQTDEAYRNLSEQINEVERSAIAASLDHRPCPRLMSLEQEKGGGDHEVGEKEEATGSSSVGQDSTTEGSQETAESGAQESTDPTEDVQQEADHNDDGPVQGVSGQCVKETNDGVLESTSVSNESASNTEVNTESAVTSTVQSTLENGQINGDFSQSEVYIPSDASIEWTKETEEVTKKTDVSVEEKEVNNAEEIDNQNKAVNEENKQESIMTTDGLKQSVRSVESVESSAAEETILSINDEIKGTSNVGNIPKSTPETLANNSSYNNTEEKTSETVANNCESDGKVNNNTESGAALDSNTKEGSPTSGGKTSERLTDSDETLSKITVCTNSVVSSTHGETLPPPDCAASNGNCLNNKNKKKKKGKK